MLLPRRNSTSGKLKSGNREWQRRPSDVSCQDLSGKDNVVFFSTLPRSYFDDAAEHAAGGSLCSTPSTTSHSSIEPPHCTTCSWRPTSTTSGLDAARGDKSREGQSDDVAGQPGSDDASRETRNGLLSGDEGPALVVQAGRFSWMSGHGTTAWRDWRLESVARVTINLT